MADPKIPARTKSKRQRWTALPDPEEITADIMNELQISRRGIDKRLAKHNKLFMQTQIEKRQQFIEYCRTRIHDLPNGVRSDVARQLLSSEDFAVEMNFSEVHTSSANSLLTWSCSDASMSDPSWRTLLQQYAEDAAAPSTPRAAKLARTTRSTSKGSSPAPSSTQIAEPSGLPTSVASSEAGMAEDALIEYDQDDRDLIATAKVTTPKPRLRGAKAQESPAGPPGHGSPSRKERQAPASRETSPKTSSSRICYWSQQECATLTDLCHGKDEALYQCVSPFWEDVSSQIPGRTQNACLLKWKHMRVARSRKKKAAGSQNVRSSKARWSAEELKKLAQCSSQPAKSCDWDKVATQFPGRTARSCYMRSKNLEAKDFETPNGVQFQGRPVLGAEPINNESEKGNMATPEGEGDASESPDGEDMEVL